MKHEQTITFKLTANASGDGVQVKMSFDPALPTTEAEMDNMPAPQLHLTAMAVDAAKAAMSALRMGEGQ